MSCPWRRPPHLPQRFGERVLIGGHATNSPAMSPGGRSRELRHHTASGTAPPPVCSTRFAFSSVKPASAILRANVSTRNRWRGWSPSRPTGSAREACQRWRGSPTPTGSCCSRRAGRSDRTAARSAAPARPPSPPRQPPAGARGRSPRCRPLGIPRPWRGSGCRSCPRHVRLPGHLGDARSLVAPLGEHATGSLLQGALLVLHASPDLE